MGKLAQRTRFKICHLLHQVKIGGSGKGLRECRYSVSKPYIFRSKFRNSGIKSGDWLVNSISASPLEKTDAQILYASGRELPEMVIQADRPPEVRL
jgi:hypothetical protein